MIEIIPAILPKSFADLEDHLSRVRGIVPWVQIDICDGLFVPNKTWPFIERDTFDTILSQEEGLPFWEAFDFEIDLMVARAKEASQEWITAGASRIIVHMESRDAHEALTSLQASRSGNGGIGVEVVAALSMETPIEVLEEGASLIDGIQVMGIDHIGFQGEPFDEKAIKRVETLVNRYPSHIVGVDGAVSKQTIRSLVAVGATRFAVGSALWDGDASANYHSLLSLASEHGG